MNNKEVVDKFIQDTLDRWVKGCEEDDPFAIQDIPDELEDNDSVNKFMDELKSRISTYKPRYTHPDKDDTMESALLSARVFARALSFLLKEKEGMGEGVVVQLDDKKYTVFTTKDQIKIDEHEDNLKDGSLLWVHYE